MKNTGSPAVASDRDPEGSATPVNRLRGDYRPENSDPDIPITDEPEGSPARTGDLWGPPPAEQGAAETAFAAPGPNRDAGLRGAGGEGLAEFLTSARSHLFAGHHEALGERQAAPRVAVDPPIPPTQWATRAQQTVLYPTGPVFATSAAPQLPLPLPQPPEPTAPLPVAAEDDADDTDDTPSSRSRWALPQVSGTSVVLALLALLVLGVVAQRVDAGSAPGTPTVTSPSGNPTDPSGIPTDKTYSSDSSGSCGTSSKEEVVGAVTFVVEQSC